MQQFDVGYSYVFFLLSGVWPLLFKKYAVDNVQKYKTGVAPDGQKGANGQIGKLKDKSLSYNLQKAVDYFKNMASQEQANRITDTIKKKVLITLNNIGEFSRNKREISNAPSKFNYFVTNDNLTSKINYNITDQRPHIATETNSNGHGSLKAFIIGSSNSSLLLLDLLMRKLTKSKPITFSYRAINQLVAQAEALKVVRACENYLDALMEQTGHQFWEFDFPSLQLKVMQKIMQLDDIENLEPIEEWALQEIHDFYANHL
jgi:hypothetical protein